MFQESEGDLEKIEAEKDFKIKYILDSVKESYPKPFEKDPDLEKKYLRYLLERNLSEIDLESETFDNFWSFTH